MTETAAAGHESAGAPQAFFSQEWAQLEDALARARARITVRCQHTLARVVFDALVQSRRAGVAVQLALPDTALNRHSAIAWERLGAIGGQIAWLPGATAATADRCFPPLVLVLDDAMVFTGKLGAGICPADDAAAVPGLVCWGDPDFVRQTRQVLDEEAAWLGQGAAPSPDESALRALQLRQDGTAVQQAWLARVLQNHALATQAEIAEMQRQMALFDHAQEQALGPLMRDYLRRKAQYLHQLALQDQAAREEAHAAQQRWEDYASAQSAREEEAGPVDLDADALDQLKQLYRKLAMQCHPDRVADGDQDRAAQLFQSLQSTYRRGDMAAMFALQESVARAGFQLPRADRTQPAVHAATQGEAADAAGQAVHARLRALRSTLAQRQDALQALRASASWRTLSSQSNWALWFDQQQQHLASELLRFESALQHGGSDPGAAAVPQDRAAPAVPHV